MRGFNRETGQKCEGVEHVIQCIKDILTTRKGTRLMFAEYGSDLPKLKDRPLNDETMIDLMSETADAISRWEKRVKVLRVVPEVVEAGKVRITLYLKYIETGDDFKVVL